MMNFKKKVAAKLVVNFSQSQVISKKKSLAKL